MTRCLAFIWTSIRKHRLLALTILIIPATALIIEIFLCNFGFWKGLVLDSHLDQRSFTLNDFSLKDLTPLGPDRVKTTSNDSWMLLESEIELKSIQLNLDIDREIFDVQVFWTQDHTLAFTPDLMVSAVFQKNSTGYYNIVLPQRVPITALRIDVASDLAVSYTCQGVTLNRPAGGLLNSLPPFQWKRFVMIALIITLTWMFIFLPESAVAWIIRKRFLLAGACFALMVLFQINTSSIGMWDYLIPDKANQNIKSEPLFGEIRAVRSDEWDVTSPFLLAQAMNSKFYPTINDNIQSSGQNMTLASGLAFNISLLSKPNYWGFILLGRNYGFAWSSCMPLLLLFLSSLEMCLLLSNGNKRLSLLGSFWITLAPAMQWWSVPILFVWMQVAVVGVIHYFKCKPGESLKKVLLAVVLSIGTSGFILSFYPPWQIPLGYLALILVACLVIPHLKAFHFTTLDFILICVSILFIASQVTGFFVLTKDAYQTMIHTAYPGARFETGGHLGLSQLFREIVTVKLPYKDGVAGFENKSELSTFISFMPFALLASLICFKRMRNKALVVLLVALILFMVSWCVFTYPPLIARVTLFSYVQPYRIVVPLGLASIYLMILVIDTLQKEPALRLGATLALALATVACYAYGSFRTGVSGFLGLPLTIVILVVYLIVVFAICRKKEKILYGFLSALVLTAGLNILPVSSGLAPIYNKTFSQEIQKIDKTDPDNKWIVLDNRYYGQFLLANGAKVINSVHYYPDMALWQKFDPDHQYSSTYNRYAHVIITLTNESTSFETPYPDIVTVNMNIDELYKTQARYVVSPKDIVSLSTAKTKFTEIYFNRMDNIFIFMADYQ